MADNITIRDTLNAGRAAPGGAPAPEMNPDDYLADMEGFDLSEAQKVELLSALWDIMRRFVEMGGDLGAVDPCGQVFDAPQEFSDSDRNGVKSPFAKATEI